MWYWVYGVDPTSKKPHEPLFLEAENGDHAAIQAEKIGMIAKGIELVPPKTEQSDDSGIHASIHNKCGSKWSFLAGLFRWQLGVFGIWLALGIATDGDPRGIWIGAVGILICPLLPLAPLICLEMISWLGKADRTEVGEQLDSGLAVEGLPHIDEAIKTGRSGNEGFTPSGGG